MKYQFFCVKLSKTVRSVKHFFVLSGVDLACLNDADLNYHLKFFYCDKKLIFQISLILKKS